MSECFLSQFSKAYKGISHLTFHSPYGLSICLLLLFHGPLSHFVIATALTPGIRDAIELVVDFFGRRHWAAHSPGAAEVGAHPDIGIGYHRLVDQLERRVHLSKCQSKMSEQVVSYVHFNVHKDQNSFRNTLKLIGVLYAR